LDFAPDRLQLREYFRICGIPTIYCHEDGCDHPIKPMHATWVHVPSAEGWTSLYARLTVNSMTNVKNVGSAAHRPRAIVKHVNSRAGGREVIAAARDDDHPALNALRRRAAAARPSVSGSAIPCSVKLSEASNTVRVCTHRAM
jgi:hypothetical protein